jgi:hypothetical protein
MPDSMYSCIPTGGGDEVSTWYPRRRVAFVLSPQRDAWSVFWFVPRFRRNICSCVGTDCLESAREYHKFDATSDRKTTHRRKSPARPLFSRENGTDVADSEPAGFYRTKRKDSFWILAPQRPRRRHYELGLNQMSRLGHQPSTSTKQE